MHTGDFKIDCTPIHGSMIDLTRFGELGREGVLALMADSTNAERPGYTPSERTVGESFANLFRKAENKRIIIATFSSNLHRIQQIVDAAVRDGRKVAVSGRSMINFVSIATELGLSHRAAGADGGYGCDQPLPEGQDDHHHHRQQGEPMSALSAWRFPDHRQVEVGRTIISSSPQPDPRQRENRRPGGQRADEARVRRGV